MSMCFCLVVSRAAQHIPVILARLVKHAATHQGVVVLNLLHGRLSRQGELDDLEVVQLLRRRSTAALNAYFSQMQS